MDEPTQTLPSYDTVAAALETLDALGSAADTHGILTAMFVSCVSIRSEAWLNSLLTQASDSTDQLVSDARNALERLYVSTQTALEGDSFEFTLMLPDDEHDFEHRIDALSTWCQGFVSGLKLVGIEHESLSDDSLQEAYNDLINMSCLEYDHEQVGDEEAESAYTELVEYARTAVMLLYQSLRVQKQGTQVSEQVH